MNIPLKSGRIHFLSGAHETFSRTDHILGLKSNLTKFKKMEIISSIFSDHRIMRIEINYREDIARTDIPYITESLAAVKSYGLEGAALCWNVMLAPEAHIDAIARMENDH